MPWLLLCSWVKDWCPLLSWVMGVPHDEGPSQTGLCLCFVQAMFLCNFCGRDFLNPSKTEHRLWGAGLLTPASWSCIAAESDPECLPVLPLMWLKPLEQMPMSWQEPGNAVQPGGVIPALLCGDEWPLSLQATVKSFILVLFAALTFTQTLISAASVAKVLQAPLQARPWSCLILCGSIGCLGCAALCSLAAVSGDPPMPTLCSGRKATRCSSWAQETGTWKQSLAIVHVLYCWCALLGQGMLLKLSVIKGLAALLCWDFTNQAQRNPAVGSAGSGWTSSTPDFSLWLGCAF